MISELENAEMKKWTMMLQKGVLQRTMMNEAVAIKVVGRHASLANVHDE